MIGAAVIGGKFKLLQPIHSSVMIKRFDIKIKLFQIAKFSRQNVVLKSKHTLRFDGKKTNFEILSILRIYCSFLGSLFFFLFDEILRGMFEAENEVGYYTSFREI